MNSIVKTVLRVGTFSRGVVLGANAARVPVKRELARAYWHVSVGRAGVTGQQGSGAGLLALHNHSNTCGCGCGLKAMHTKGERELVEFLTEEIVAERKAQKSKTLPSALDDFTVKADGAEITLSKTNKDETINITWNVNHTVDSEEEVEVEGGGAGAEQQEFAEMRSKPQFEVDIVRGDSTLSFTCSFLQDTDVQDNNDYSDVFGIDEITLYSGEWNDKVYCVAGDVLDGYLYDLLMNVLEEKGVSNEFVSRLSDLSTVYEHDAYINLLERISNFTIGK